MSSLCPFGIKKKAVLIILSIILSLLFIFILAMNDAVSHSFFEIYTRTPTVHQDLIKNKVSSSRVFPSSRQKHKIVILVFPGDVIGLHQNDRKYRLEAIAKTWGHQKEEGSAMNQTTRNLMNNIEILYVPDTLKEERDEGLDKKTFFAFPKTSSRTTYNLEEKVDIVDKEVILRWAQEEQNLHRGETSSPQRHNGDASTDVKFLTYRYYLERVSQELNPDFLMMLHDHTFLIVENLACYLRDFDANDFLYTGNLLKISNSQSPRRWFQSEPGGAVFSRTALNILTRHWQRKAVGGKGRRGSASDQIGALRTFCMPTTALHRMSPCHLISECFYDHFQAINVRKRSAGQPEIPSEFIFKDSREWPGGYERFHVYGPVRSMGQHYDPWYIQYKNATHKAELPCCTTAPITFHWVEYPEAVFLHEHIVVPQRATKNKKEEDTTVNNPKKTDGESWMRRKKELLARYPKEDEIGGYGMVPVSSHDKVLDFLLSWKVGC